MTVRRTLGWCVAQAYRLTGSRRRALARVREAEAILPVVFHAASAREVRSCLRTLLEWLPPDKLEVSFDDGWRELLATVPVLEELGIMATVFVAPGEIERGCVWTNRAMGHVPDRIWRSWYALPADERYARLDAAIGTPGERRLLTAAEVRELAGHPLVRIGNHTWSHLSCTHHSPETVREEVLRAQRVLAEWCGYAPAVFAYPFGRGSARLDSLLESLGLVPYYTRQGLVTEATRGAARNVFYEGMTMSENIARLLQAWPRVGETR